ncbi:MAG: hypothetical protein IH598_11115 [Bacteroidales bacterium]|nr:hypothetical protein [Bacteroidales bacterium]
MLHFIRSYIIRFLIQRELKTFTRTKKVVNLAQASSIGIIFSLESEEEYQYINSISSKLIQAGKDVKIIGFIPDKVIPNYYLAKLKMDIFTKKELNFLGICKKPIVERFINEEFDLLVDLSPVDYLSLDYISGCSHANFKTGRFRENMIDVFDFMIKKPEEMSNKTFFETVVNYLRTINTK